MANAKNLEAHKFKKGQGGRPKGAKNKLAESFWAEMASAWEKHGKTAIEKLATQEPAKFVQVVASVMPKEITVDRYDSMTMPEIDARIAELAAKLGIVLDLTAESNDANTKH